MSIYSNSREHLAYYRYIRNLLSMLSCGCESIIDIGSNDIDVISHLHCSRRVSLDIKKPLEKNGIETIKADFFKQSFKEQFDIVCCFEVLEHLENADIFAQKLIQTGRLIVVSVPYKWKIGECKFHCQDPIDADKLISWFNREPLFLQVVSRRMIAVFSSENIADELFKINGINFKDNYNWDKDLKKFKENSIEKKISLTLQKEGINIVDKKEDCQPNKGAEEKLNKERLYHFALYNNADNEKYFKLGLEMFPDERDKYGHPLFLKEYIRFLLKNGRFNEAVNVLHDKKINKDLDVRPKWIDRLFARAYEQYGQYDHALKLFMSFLPTNDAEITKAIKRLKAKVSSK